MKFLRALTEKPWAATEMPAASLHAGSADTAAVMRLGLKVFLAVVTVLFSLLAVAYTDRMAFADWRPMPEPWLLWLNTAVLILSSVGLQRAWGAARRGEPDQLRLGLHAAGAFAFVFLVGQLLAWQQLVDLGYYASTNPANAFFYLITALHGLHLSGGLVAWGKTAAKVWSGLTPTQVRLSVELCAIYWHFLLVVWLILFGLLLVT
jgi:cytochrome c oxidase subunit 3